MFDIHYSLQKNIVCKPDKEQEKHHAKQGHYDKGWEGVYTEAVSFVEDVCVKGYAWSSSTYRNHERKSNQFLKSDLFALDFDNKPDANKPGTYKLTTPQDVLDNHPMRDGILLIYYSSSHTEEQPRFRVVFRIEDCIADRKNYRLFSHKLHAVSSANFDGLDLCLDEARLWYGSNKGSFYFNPQAKVNLFELDKVWFELDENTKKHYEARALKPVVDRKVLVERGLISKTDAYIGDPETEQKITELCLKYIPQWEEENWYSAGCWIFGASVHTLGVELAAEVLEKVWGEYPRAHKRDLFDELQQWEVDSMSSENAGLGSIIHHARENPDWGDKEDEQLKSLQREGAERASFNDKYRYELSLQAVQEFFAVTEVDRNESLAPALNDSSIDAKMTAVEGGIREIIRDTNSRRHNAKAQYLNEMFQRPFPSKDIEKMVREFCIEYRESSNAGEKPVLGTEACIDYLLEEDKQPGFIIQKIIPQGTCTLLGGAPKVGKTSSIVAMLIGALIGKEPASGLRGKKFSHLTIFSDDQALKVTRNYIKQGLRGFGVETTREGLENALGTAELNLYHSLKLDENGVEKLTQKATKTPGGVFVVDSLTSTGGKLGISENDATISQVIYQLRNAIESVDPTATLIIIHHLTKGGTSQGKDQVNSFRGSSAITGAVDNILTIEKPTVKQDGKYVTLDMTNDRVFHISGRGSVDSKIVLKSEIQTRMEEDQDGVETEVHFSTSFTYLCEFAEYDQHKETPYEFKPLDTVIDDLPASAKEVWDIVKLHPDGIQQSAISKDMRGGTLSKAVQKLREKRLVIIHEDQVGDRTFKMVYPEKNSVF